MDLNFMSAAKLADKLTKKSVKISRFLEGNFPTPTLFTEKGLTNARIAQLRLKGGLMAESEIKENIDFMLKADRDNFVDSHLLTLIDTAESTEVVNQIKAMKPRFKAHIENLYNNAKIVKRGLFPTKAQAKANEIAETLEVK